MIFQDMKKNVQNLTGTLRIQYKLTLLYPSADAGQEFSGWALQTGNGRSEKATCICIERLSTSQGLPLRHTYMTKEMIQWLGLQDESENIKQPNQDENTDFKNNRTVPQLPEDAAGMERHRVRLPL